MRLLESLHSLCQKRLDAMKQISKDTATGHEDGALEDFQKSVKEGKKAQRQAKSSFKAGLKAVAAMQSDPEYKKIQYRREKTQQNLNEAINNGHSESEISEAKGHAERAEKDHQNYHERARVNGDKSRGKGSGSENNWAAWDAENPSR
jgi:hypothetical protein